MSARRSRRGLRLTVRLTAAVVLAVVAYLGVTAVQVWRAGRHDGTRPAQAIVVLGAAQYDGRPSAVLRARLDHAVALWRAKVAPVVFVTGGKEPGDRETESAASADYLAKAGVPQSAVLREVAGRNSWQSLAEVAAELDRRRWAQVVLVSDPFHAERIRAMAGELGLDATVSPTTTSPIHGARSLPYYAKETLAVAAGRIVGFRRLVGIDERMRSVRSPTPSR